MQEVFEKIIEGLDKSSDHYECEEQGREDVYMVDLEKAIEIVKEVAAEYNNGWIPCSERLPEVGRYDNGEPKCYLTMIRGAEVPTELYVDKDGKWHNYCIVYYHHDYREFEVIAWQPLPAPYKPKED